MRAVSKPLTLALGLVSLTSLAQTPTTSFPLERLRLTTDRSAIIDVEWGRVLPHLQWDVGLQVGYAHNPLVVFRKADGERLGALVPSRLGGSVAFGLGLFDWVQVSAEVPFVLWQVGAREIAGATSAPLPALRTTGFGDARLVPKLRLLRQENAFVDVALQLNVFLPLGGGTQYLGDRSVILAPEAAISRTFGGLRLAGNLGVSALRPTQTLGDLTVDNELSWRLGAGFRFREHQAAWIPLEVDGALASSTALSAPYRRANQHSLEARLQAGWHFDSGLLPFVGGGLGLQPGWGTPDWRVYAGLRFALPKPAAPRAPPDTDGDGLADPDDGCPALAGPVALGGCPDLDADGDGLVDRLDKCPRQAEDKDGHQDDDGCLDADDDQDGVADVVDRCRLEPEDADGFEDTDGCPDPDNDRDGVVDAADACPMEPGVIENRGCPDKDSDGDGLVDRLDNCPTEKGPKENAGCARKQLVVLTSEKLEILDSVYFKLNQAVIERRSYGLLDNVAAVLQGHPEIKRVRIEGHTDSQGDDARNLRLSQARAEAVRDYLVKRGIDAARLVPVGYGETRPVATNDTKEGRARNRRVEFNLGDADSPRIRKSDTGPGTDTLER